jgi:cobalt-zinc-cadmium efflux system outer membrane protein
MDFLFERGHKRQHRMEVAKNQIEFARLEVLNAVRELLLSVRSAFVDLQLAKRSLDLAQENLQALTDITEVNKARVKAGDLADVELVRTRLAALQFQNQVKQAELKVRAAKNRLQLLLGRVTPNPAFDIAGEFRQDPGPTAAAELESKALELRPDLRSLRQSQVGSQAALRLALAQGKVDYTIGSEYRRQQGVNGTGNSVGLFLQTNLPIFNRNQGEIERVRRQQQQIEARIRDLQATIQMEVRNSFEQYRTAQELLASIEKDMLGQAKDVREITAYSYRRGEATLIEFLDAQRAFNETMQAYNEARAEYARSLYALESAAGIEGGNR